MLIIWQLNQSPLHIYHAIRCFGIQVSADRCEHFRQIVEGRSVKITYMSFHVLDFYLRQVTTLASPGTEPIDLLFLWLDLWSVAAYSQC